VHPDSWPAPDRRSFVSHSSARLGHAGDAGFTCHGPVHRDGAAIRDAVTTALADAGYLVCGQGDRTLLWDLAAGLAFEITCQRDLVPGRAGRRYVRMTEIAKAQRPPFGQRGRSGRRIRRPRMLTFGTVRPSDRPDSLDWALKRT